MSRIKNKDIAKALGISPSAVSFALNNKPGVSDKTRKAVFDFVNQSLSIEQINALTTKILDTLLFVIHKRHGKIIIDKPFFANLIESVQIEGNKNGYNTTISHFTNELDLTTHIDTINQHKPKGVILLATEISESELSEYKKLACPFVLLDASFDFEKNDSVTIDNTNAIFNAFKYAYDLGHRRIGYFRSNIEIQNFEHRYQGYLKALCYYGINFENDFVITLDSTIEESYQKMNQYLSYMPKNQNLPTCFLSDLDYIALGAMKSLKEHGFNVPNDISIIGFDDIVACEISNPRLTTIRVNRHDIGRIAVKILNDRIRSKANYYSAVQVSSELIIRESIIDVRAKY